MKVRVSLLVLTCLLAGKITDAELFFAANSTREGGGGPNVDDTSSVVSSFALVLASLVAIFEDSVEDIFDWSAGGCGGCAGAGAGAGCIFFRIDRACPMVNCRQRMGHCW